MGERRYTLLDVFTSTPLNGNPLAVVHDADDVDDATMLAFARETGLSETSFVQTPRAEGADYRNRIWMMSGEIPFAGHPSLGVAVAVARERGDAGTRLVQETGAGLQPIDVRLEGDRARASMLQEPPVFGPQLDAPSSFAPLGLSAADGDPSLAPQVVSTGAPQVLVPVRDVEALGRIRPDWERLEAVIATHDAIVVYAAACDPRAGTARARSFTRSADMGEDAATGSAAGPLCAYLARWAGTPKVRIDQGIEMGRPSALEAEMEDDRPRVGGDVVVIVDGTVRLP